MQLLELVSRVAVLSLRNRWWVGRREEVDSYSPMESFRNYWFLVRIKPAAAVHFLPCSKARILV